MIWLRRLAVATLLAAGTAQAAPPDMECSAAANLAELAMQARDEGITEGAVMAALQEHGITSGLPIWAISAGFDAPRGMVQADLKGSVMAECRERVQ